MTTVRELVSGQLVQIEETTRDHEIIVAQLITALGGWARTHGGMTLASGYKVRITDDTAFMPDVQYYCRGHKTPELGLDEGAPDLVVEVISPTSAHFDQVQKLNAYAAIGTAEYWLIDPDHRTFHRFVLGAGSHFEEQEVLKDDATFRPSSFPGLELHLSELWTLPQ